MDHIVYLNARFRELENLLNGNKSMIIRGDSGKSIPYGRVEEGDILYFVNNKGEKYIRARGIVSSVVNLEKLTVEESFETVIRFQDKLQLPDRQFERWAGKSCLVLITLDNIEQIRPFLINRGFLDSKDTWLPVGKIENAITSSLQVKE